MQTYLKIKIKIKSLVSEARIIRAEEAKVLKWRRRAAERQKAAAILERLDSEYISLRDHRKREVRREARASNLAYGYLRGRPYKVIEQDPHTRPNRERVAEIVAKFGGMKKPEARERIDTWLDAELIEKAKAGLDALLEKAAAATEPTIVAPLKQSVFRRLLGGKP
jgi:hypothetical protein